MKIIAIGKPEIVKINPTKVKLFSNVSLYDELNVIKKWNLFIEVFEEYSDYLVEENSDCFLLAVLPFAMDKGYNIVCKAPISSEMYYNIVYQYMPCMKKGDARLHVISIDCELSDEHISSSNGVVTGLSLGVDSFVSIFKHMDLDTSYNLTHLAFIFHESTYYYQHIRADEVANILGLPLVHIGSNILPSFKEYFNCALSIFHIAILSALKKLWSVYYMSSGFDVTNSTIVNNTSKTSCQYYDIFLSGLISTSSFRVYSDGVDMSRFEKINYISMFPMTYKYLNPCDEIFLEKNCGWCDKCIRSLSDMDSIGVLDKYRPSYDIRCYERNKKSYLRYVYMKRESSFFADSYKILNKKYSSIFDEIREEVKLNKFDIEYVTRMAIGEGNYCAQYIYSKRCLTGRWANKDTEDSIKWIKIAYENNNQYLPNLVNILRKYGCDEDRKYVLKVLTDNCKTNDFAAITLANDYANGTNGVDINYQLAVELLKRASEMNKKWIVSYIDLLLKSSERIEHEKAFSVAWENIVLGSDIQLRLAMMYEQGKGCEKDINSAIYWYSVAYRKNPICYKKYASCLKLTNNKNDNILAEKILLLNEKSE